MPEWRTYTGDGAILGAVGPSAQAGASSLSRHSVSRACFDGFLLENGPKWGEEPVLALVAGTSVSSAAGPDFGATS